MATNPFSLALNQTFQPTTTKQPSWQNPLGTKFGSQPDWPTDTGSPGPTAPNPQTPQAPTGDPYAPQAQASATPLQNLASALRPPSSGSVGRPTRGMTREQVQAFVEGYFRERNTTPLPTSVQYWVDKYFSPEFNNDVDYWFDRLGKADEFGGGGGTGSISPFQFQMPTHQTFSGGTAINIPKVNTAPPAGYSVPTTNPMLELAQQLVSKLAAQAPPDTAGQKEASKELLLSLRRQGLDQAEQSAASRGIDGGWLMGREAALDDAFAGNLTASYRDIEAKAEQQEFANLLAAQAAASGLGQNLFGNTLANKRLGLDASLGFGGLENSRLALQIQQMLGLNNLDLEGRRLDLDAALGAAGLNNDWWRIFLETTR